MRLGILAKFSVSPFNGERSPSQSISGSNCTRIAEAVANSCGVRSEAISVGETRGQLEPCVLAELHKKAEVVGEGKVLIATCDCRLQRLLDSLLGVEPDRRI